MHWCVESDKLSEERAVYRVVQPDLLQTCDKPAMIDAELDTVRVELVELERRLIPLLVAIQRALGKEPMVVTRSERRAR